MQHKNINKKARYLTKEENDYVLEKLYQFSVSSHIYLIHEKHSHLFDNFTGTISDFDSCAMPSILKLNEIVRNYEDNVYFKISETETLNDVILENSYGLLNSVALSMTHIIDEDSDEEVNKDKSYATPPPFLDLLQNFVEQDEPMKDFRTKFIFHHNDSYPDVCICPLNILHHSRFDINLTLNTEVARSVIFNRLNKSIELCKSSYFEQMVYVTHLNGSQGEYNNFNLYINESNFLIDDNHENNPKFIAFMLEDEKRLKEICVHEELHLIDHLLYNNFIEPHIGDKKPKNSNHHLITLFANDNDVRDIVKNNTPLINFLDCINDFHKLPQDLSLEEYSYDLRSHMHYAKELITSVTNMKQVTLVNLDASVIDKLLVLREKYLSFKAIENSDDLIVFRKFYKKDDLSISKKKEIIEKSMTNRFYHLLNRIDVFHHINIPVHIIESMVTALKYDFTDKTVKPESSLFYTFAQLTDHLNMKYYFTYSHEMLAFIGSMDNFETTQCGLPQKYEGNIFISKLKNCFEELSSQFPKLSVSNILESNLKYKYFKRHKP